MLTKLSFLNKKKVYGMFLIVMETLLQNQQMSLP